MKLAALIAKGGLRHVATAIPAIPAIPDPLRKDAVAGVAIVAIARSANPSLIPVPEHLSELASRICLWRVEEPGQPTRYVVAGPDHDLRGLHPGAVPLFDRLHCEYVRAVPDPNAADEAMR